MKKIFITFFVFLSVILKSNAALHLPEKIYRAFSSTTVKPRVLVLTDIQNEPDDTESLIRFLTYSNQFDVEGFIATTSVWLKDRVEPDSVKSIISKYALVRNNLLKHESGFPAAGYLLNRVKAGLPKLGMDGVGAGNDSEGSDFIITVVDKNDPRPVWIPVWGGANCLAQALWKVRATRTPAAVAKFVNKIRVYTISDQDNSGPWIRQNFPGLFFIFSANTWWGIAGDNFQEGFTGADTTLINRSWVNKNIRYNHGPFAAAYPQLMHIMEGDTPSFLYLVNNGLSNPENPGFGGWGGRYTRYKDSSAQLYKNFWVDAADSVYGIDGQWHFSDKATVWRWRQAFQNDFEARIDWSNTPVTTDANHPPVVKVKSNALTVKGGKPVELSDAGSFDPDKNNLHYNWMYYKEAGTYNGGAVKLVKTSSGKKVTITTPLVGKPQTLHFIFSVTDDGKPALTRYQRVIIKVLP